MVLSHCYSFIKYTLIFINLIFWVLGLTGVILGIWMLVDNTFVVSLTQEQHNYHAGLYIMLAAGALLLIVSFLGCCGAFRESQCMLVSFFSCLLVVVVAQIAIGAWLYTNRDRIEPLVKTAFTNTVKNEYGEIKYRTETVDSIQKGLKCCGANGPSDWAGSKYGNPQFANNPVSLTVTSPNTVFDIPESCCKTTDYELCKSIRKVTVAGIISEEIYSEGCVNKLISVLSDQGFTIIAVIIGVGVCELIGLIFSLVLCCAIGSSDRYKA